MSSKDTRIETYKFSNDGLALVKGATHGNDWPVVYIIANEKSKKMYIGETSNAARRMENHLNNNERHELKEMHILFDDQFNKSAVLDIENSLIQLVSADNIFTLQNRNGGQSPKHDYYQRALYQEKIPQIWAMLQKKNLASKQYEEILNTDLFKFSPYNTLNAEQTSACNSILKDIVDKLDNGIKAASVIRGSVGTGKTVVLINILYKLINATQFEIDDTDVDEELSDYLAIKKMISEYVSRKGALKVAIVFPMVSIRKTLKAVFKQTKHGLKGNLVIGTTDVADKGYDVLLVDEAHRLPHYRNIGWMGPYRKRCRALFGEDADPNRITTLDWVLKQSKYTILVYDSTQSVKGSDITKDEYERALTDPSNPISVNDIYLTSQMRCRGGDSYVSYIDSILSCGRKSYEAVMNYDFKLFSQVNEMVDAIKAKDNEIGLCRNVAGYSWEWISKGENSHAEIRKNGLEDIEIQGHRYIWNMSNTDFMLRKEAVDEIGCIHTTQGYDMNYVGVIFGREIDYDPERNCIVINRKLFFDTNVMANASDAQLKEYIINSYKVLLTRGIRGCYVYAFNKNMKDYLARFIPEAGPTA